MKPGFLNSGQFLLIFLILPLFFCAYAQDSLRVRMKGIGTTADAAVKNAKLSVLEKAGWSVDEEELSKTEYDAQMKTNIIDTKVLADSSYQVIIDASLKTDYESTIVGAGVFVAVAITSLVLIVLWGAVTFAGG